MRKVLLLLCLSFIISCSDKQIKMSDVLVPNAKEILLSQLKTPRSAVFNDEKTSVFDTSKENELLWCVKLNVDSQNSFGAMLNKTYYVIFDWNGKDTLNIDNFKFKKVY